MSRPPGRKPTNDPPVRLVATIPLSLRERLMVESATVQRSMSDLVREALTRYLTEGGNA